MFFAVLVTLFSILVLWLWTNSKHKKYPPGPVGLPIIGHLPLLGKEAHKTLMKWSETYGPVIGLSLASYRAVFIHDIKLIREAMNINELSARPELIQYMARGLNACHGKQLTEQRNFFLKTLREFGAGSKSLEAKISDEISVLLNSFRATAGKPCELQFAFNIALLNSLCSIMFSETLEPNDPKVHEIMRKLSLTMSDFNFLNGLTAFFPSLNHIVPENKTIKYVFTNFRDNLEGFVKEKLDKHQEGYVEDHPRDIADAYEDKVRKTTDITSTFHPRHNFLLRTLSEMFVGGMDSANKSLQWIIAYLINYPEVQKKLQVEIDSVIGHNRLPSLSDRQSMNYTEAVIHEVLRHCSMNAMSGPRRALEDAEFHGYVIPKDAIVIVNLYSCNHDKGIWGDPQNFRPEHFLDTTGRFTPNQSSFVPFGIGKQACPGESFARDQLFLVITNLYQQFNIYSVGSSPTLEPICGMGLFPPPFEVIFKERSAVS